MKAHGKNVNNPKYKDTSRAIRKAYRKDKEGYTKKTVQQLWDCKHRRASERYKEIQTLIKKFPPNMQKVKN